MKESKKRSCLYCGSKEYPTKEHVLPEALGTNCFIRPVCRDCNNAFSKLDGEFIGRSIISFFCFQEFSDSAIDASLRSNGIVYEARANKLKTGEFTIKEMPQILLTDCVPTSYCGLNEYELNTLTKAAIESYNTKAKSTIQYKRRRHIAQGEVYPGRIFLKNSHVSSNHTVFIGYTDEKDKLDVQTWLGDGAPITPSTLQRIESKSLKTPGVGIDANQHRIALFLLKTSTNLLLFTEPQRSDRLPQLTLDMINMIKGKTPPYKELLEQSGPIEPLPDIPDTCRDGYHTAWILPWKQNVLVYYSFFGGSFCARSVLRLNCEASLVTQIWRVAISYRGEKNEVEEFNIIPFNPDRLTRAQVNLHETGQNPSFLEGASLVCKGYYSKKVTPRT